MCKDSSLEMIPMTAMHVPWVCRCAVTALQCLTRLTHLDIQNINCHLTCSMLPRLSALTALQHLSFSTAKRNDNLWPRVFELEPSVLPVPPQLQHLHISQVHLDINTTRGSDFLAWLASLEHPSHTSTFRI